MTTDPFDETIEDKLLTAGVDPWAHDSEQQWLDLIERYREKFGEPPPVLWCDPESERPKQAKLIEAAIESGKPWVRPELEDLPEGVLI